MIIAVIALVISVGLALKVMSNTSNNVQSKEQLDQRVSSVDPSLENKVQLVAAEFKCACGGCGELPLIVCDCDMPRGAVEEKAFIREKLKEGLPVDQVIQSLETKYGLRITS